MVSALDTKLARDLWSLKTQVLSIALVIASGIAGFIGCFSTYGSLRWSRDHYYDTARFAHVFAYAKRAPQSLAARIAEIPGVAEAETRVVRDAQLSLPGVTPPMVARLIGFDVAHPPGMNRLTLTQGRWPASGAAQEVLVNQRFVEARKLKLGERLQVLINGKLESLLLVGTVLTPEYIYPTRGGALPDDEWFAIVWMDERTLAAAFNMEGAFNSVVVRLQHGASLERSAEALDGLLAPYGGLGAAGRADQASDRILSQEISQQRVFGTVLPAVFLFVAAFILNVVLHRQVNAQRGEIAALKALGYDDRRIAAHYLKFAAVVVAIGIVLGIGFGRWFGVAMTRLYTNLFHFPDFNFFMPAWVVLAGAGLALFAAFGGAIAATGGVVRLKPAEALRPPAPAEFRPLLVERLGVPELLTPSQRMIMRSLERKPLRALVTVAGVVASVAILIAGTFWADGLEWFIDVQFNKVQRASVTVAFAEPVSASVVGELARLPGVLQVEGSRAIPVRLRAGTRTYRTALPGVSDDAQLVRILDAKLGEARPVSGGVVLTRRLARRLGVAPGERVQAELLEGQRVQADLVVAATADEMVGMNAWLRLEDLNRLARDGDVVSSASLLVDRADEPALLARLKESPAAANVIVMRSLLKTFRDTSAYNILFFTTVLSLFAATIAAGVVYNNARIQLAEREWELASLRVLGFTRGEVSLFLLGELAVEIALAIPLGFVAGYWLSTLILVFMQQEVFQFPMIIFRSTYLYAGAMIAVAGVLSALVVRNRVDRLDLVAVLKTRE